MTSGETDSKTITRFVVVGVAALALLGLTLLLTGSNSSLFADQTFANVPMSVDTAQ